MLTRYRAEALSSGEWESEGEREREREESGRVAQEESGRIFILHKCLEHKCLVPSETLCLLPSTLLPLPSSIGLLPSDFFLLPSSFFLLKLSVKIVDASGYTFC